MTKESTYCVIMAGGIGSRFWPLSRTDRPKQFLDFLGLGRSLLQQTYDRFIGICPKQNILVVTNANYTSLVLEQLPDLAPDQVLREPERRNTAPCVAYSNHAITAMIRRQGGDPNTARIIVTPSDHLVLKEEAFRETVQLALHQAAEEDCLVTLGITPSRPDTGYGYIQFAPEGKSTHPRVKRVRRFTEKPDHETAVEFIESGDHVWNAGIFVWSLGSITKAFRDHLPELEDRFAKATNAFGTEDEPNALQGIYKDLPNVSIDYGIMEKAANVFTVVSDFGWSDLGTWGSLFTHMPKDGQGNAVVGKNVRLYDCERNMVRGHGGRLVILQGLQDHIVIDTPDALLVCSKQEEQMIKQFVSDLKADGDEGHI